MKPPTTPINANQPSCAGSNWKPGAANPNSGWNPMNADDTAYPMIDAIIDGMMASTSMSSRGRHLVASKVGEEEMGRQGERLIEGDGAKAGDDADEAAQDQPLAHVGRVAHMPRRLGGERPGLNA